MMRFFFHLIILLIIIFQVSCSDDQDANRQLFKVTTDSIVLDTTGTNFSELSVKIYGVTDQHKAYINRMGTCYSESPNPTVSDKITEINNQSSLDEKNYLITNTAMKLKPNTVYYFRNFVETTKGLQYGDELSYKTSGSVIFYNTSHTIHYGTCVIRSTIKSDGGTPILSSGFVWSVSPNPTVDLMTKITQLPDGENVVTATIPDLEKASTYYLRCFVINKSGVSYGNQIRINTVNIISSTPVTDIDGNTYQTIRIGDQIWMCQNLRTTRYQNGDPILTTIPVSKEISAETSPKYQWTYNGSEADIEKYGRLYTWYTATDSRNIAPAGWRVPSEADFATLEAYLERNGCNYTEANGLFADTLAKSLSSTTLWSTSQTHGTVGYELAKNNLTGFNAYPAGIKISNGSFMYMGSTTIFWNTDSENSKNGKARQLVSNYSDFWNCYCPMEFGCSVRCIKDVSGKVSKQLNNANAYTTKKNNGGICR